MRVLWLTIPLLLFAACLHAQGVGVNTPTPDPSAALEVQGVRQGFLVPRMPQSERDAIAAPAEGLLIYNTTTHCLNMWNASQWIEFCSTTPPCQEPPAPAAGSNSPVCLGRTLSLTASPVGGATYIWSGPDNYYNTTQNPSIASLQAHQVGTYTVRVFVAGCYSTTSAVTVTALPNPYTAVANFANTRYDAGSFTIGQRGFVVGGQNTSVFRYDADTDTWAARANFPTANYVDCDGWGDATYGYVLEGGSGTNKRLYRFDDAANTWTEISTYPGSAIQGRSVARIGNLVYVGLGNNSGGTKASDWWAYNIAANTCTARTGISGGGVGYAATFALGGKVYVVGGAKGTGFGSTSTQVKIYDPATDSWSDGTTYPGSNFGEGIGVAYGGYGYVGTGTTNGTDRLDAIYRYDPAANSWTQLPCNYPQGASEIQPFIMANGDVYLAGGWNGSANLQGVYRFTP